MPDYVAALDDSGGIEPLLTWHGDFIPGDHPITTLSLLLIRRDLLPAFEERWLKLRRKMQRELGCSQLPPIHLRLMYGRTLPKKYRKRPNPYLQANFAQIVEWIEDAYRILWTFGKKSRGLVWGVFSKSRREVAQPLQRYFRDPHLYAELKFMKEHSKSKASRNMADRYRKKITSPLLPLMLDAFLYMNELVRQLKGNEVDLVIDSFHDAHGIEVEEVLGAINNISHLQRIRSIERVENGDESSLVQAADLVGFINFRKLLFQYRNEPPDPILERIVQKYPFSQFDFDKVTRAVSRNYPESHALSQGIFYLVAKRVVEKANPAFAQQYMIDADELVKRYRVAMREDLSGVSVLKDASVCNHLVSPINGQDPG